MFGPELIESINNGGFFVPANMSFNKWKEIAKSIDEIDSDILDSYTDVKVFTGEGEVDISNLKEEELHNVGMDSDLSAYEGKYLIAYIGADKSKIFIISGPISDDIAPNSHL
ncbi:hypothetical protein IWW36_003401 [Coemansia brasiliensis]|uniref:Uncharacterized protein n=1 Tax=Coemansia brasiliensis TaxID=2650707 RepID=A0A9W8LZT3_9FUNG|nr:hypothetical protein IWW36_003401 [Coemansia brasiliensis]